MHNTERAFGAINAFVKKNGYFPSLSQLAAKLNVTKAMTQRYVLALEQLRLLERNERGSIISVSGTAPKNVQWFTFIPTQSPKHGKRSRSKR